MQDKYQVITYCRHWYTILVRSSHNGAVEPLKIHPEGTLVVFETKEQAQSYIDKVLKKKKEKILC